MKTGGLRMGKSLTLLYALYRFKWLVRALLHFSFSKPGNRYPNSKDEYSDCTRDKRKQLKYTISNSCCKFLHEARNHISAVTVWIHHPETCVWY